MLSVDKLTSNGATKLSSFIAKLVQVDRQYSMKKKWQHSNLVPNQLGSGLQALRCVDETKEALLAANHRQKIAHVMSCFAVLSVIVDW